MALFLLLCRRLRSTMARPTSPQLIHGSSLHSCPLCICPFSVKSRIIIIIITILSCWRKGDTSLKSNLVQYILHTYIRDGEIKCVALVLLLHTGSSVSQPSSSCPRCFSAKSSIHTYSACIFDCVSARVWVCTRPHCHHHIFVESCGKRFPTTVRGQIASKYRGRRERAWHDVLSYKIKKFVAGRKTKRRREEKKKPDEIWPSTSQNLPNQRTRYEHHTPNTQ